MEKKGLMLTSLLFLMNFVSAYGERSGILVGNMYLDLDLIISIGIFMTIFVALSLATRKMNVFHTEGARIFISFVIALFSIYGLSKANVDYQTLFIDWGIQNFLMDFGAWIILAFCLLIIIIYNIRTLILVVSGAFIAMGITGMFSEEIIYNWEISLMIGITLLLFYLWLRKKGPKFKLKKTSVTPGMGILDIITTKGERKYADGYRVDLELGFKQITKFYIRNSGEADLEWRIKSQRGLRLSKTNGKLSKGMHSAIGVRSLVNDGHPREIVIYARSIEDKKVKTQIATIIITQGEAPSQQTSEPTPKKPLEETGTAGFGLSIAGQDYPNVGGKTISVNMTPNSEIDMTLFNSGKGEELYWTRRLDSKVSSNLSRGRIGAGRRQLVKLAVGDVKSKKKTVIVYGKDRNQKGWQQAAIIINLDQSGRPTASTSGAARFDLFVGEKSYANPKGKVNSVTIAEAGQTRIFVKNGGSGGTLTWKAAASSGIKINNKEGKLKKGQTSEIDVTVIDTSTPHQHVTIIGKRGVDKGARDLIKRAVGKVLIPIEIKIEPLKFGAKATSTYSKPKDNKNSKMTQKNIDDIQIGWSHNKQNIENSIYNFERTNKKRWLTNSLGDLDDLKKSYKKLQNKSPQIQTILDEIEDYKKDIKERLK